MMKRLCATAFLIAWTLCASAAEKSTTIVYIDGAKYYIHTVQTGETLYALAKMYGIDEKVIVEKNPSAATGLKAAENLRIPVVGGVEELPSEKKLAKTFNFHFVIKGETLFGISRQFEIPVNTIIADNPNIDPIHLRLGERILIRKKQVGSENEAGSREQWENYRKSLNSVADAGMGYHLVQTGETVYSISRRYATSEEELGRLNNGLKAADLKAGAIIKVPQESSVATTESVGGLPNVITPAEVVLEPEVKTPDFKALHSHESLNVALLLPLAVQGEANNNYLEFYQGFLLGLDTIRTKLGYSVDLNVYNTARNVGKIGTITDDETFRKAQLIIGPVYEENMPQVIEYAAKEHIPVVSPLASLSHTNSEVVFQLAPDPAGKYEKVADLQADGKQITLIYTESTDKEFEREIMAWLGKRAYSRYTYKYVHPSSAKAAVNSPSDLTPLLDNGADNLFIVMADKEVDVDRILAAITSADISISSRGLTPSKFTVLGNARWNRYNNIDRSIFFKDHVVFVSTYHAKRDSEAIRLFDEAYIRTFGSLPTLYAYRGFDSALIFVPSMYGDIEENLAGRDYTPLQTTYRFEQQTDSGNHVNTNWTRVNYNSNYTITIE